MTQLAGMLHLLIVFHHFWHLLTYLFLYIFSLLFRLGNFYYSIKVYRFLPLSSLVTLFCILKHPFGSFYNFSFSVGNYCPFVSRVSNLTSWNTDIIAILKCYWIYIIKIQITTMGSAGIECLVSYELLRYFSYSLYLK